MVQRHQKGKRSEHLRKLGYYLIKIVPVEKEIHTVTVISEVRIEILFENTKNTEEIGVYAKNKYLPKMCFDIQEEKGIRTIIISVWPKTFSINCIVLAIPDTARFAVKTKI